MLKIFQRENQQYSNVAFHQYHLFLPNITKTQVTSEPLSKLEGLPVQIMEWRDIFILQNMTDWYCLPDFITNCNDAVAQYFQASCDWWMSHAKSTTMENGWSLNAMIAIILAAVSLVLVLLTLNIDQTEIPAGDIGQHWHTTLRLDG